MSDSLIYIDNYFTGRLSATEKEAFEDQCASDPAFVEEVAFYVAVRDSLKLELHQQKKKEFAELYTELSHAEKPPANLVTKMLAYATAACILLVAGWILFFKAPSVKTMANRYIKKELKILSVTMSGSTDSLQMGITAYNNKNYNEAERIFQNLASQPVTSAEAAKNLGVVYLVTGKYDQALLQFEALARRSDLYTNPGLFYKALVLMKRSARGDRAKAKEILDEVIKKDLPWSKEAKIWIQKL